MLYNNATKIMKVKELFCFSLSPHCSYWNPIFFITNNQMYFYNAKSSTILWIRDMEDIY
jgi:hypothetical protein